MATDVPTVLVIVSILRVTVNTINIEHIYYDNVIIIIQIIIIIQSLFVAEKTHEFT